MVTREEYCLFSLLFNFIILFSSNVFIQGTDVKAFDDTVLFKINWPGKTGGDLLDTSNSEPLFVTTENNERYKCLLPQFQEKEKDSVDSYTGPNPLELLAPLFTQSSCSYRLESYWTYELCHGRFVRQYHEEREGKKVKLQEFYLGRWNKTQFAKLNEEMSQKEIQEKEMREGKSSHDEVPMKKIDGLNMPYLQVNMSDGTICDLNGKSRLTKVLYVCYNHGKHDIFSLKETSTCEYEVIVLSPLLCQHPKYKPQESGETIINCLPVEGSPKKPKNLIQMEAESLKLRHQKVTDEKLQKVYAVFSIERNGEGQDGEARVHVEIHPVDVTAVDNDDMGLAPPPDSPGETTPLTDMSPVISFLSGKNCLNGGSGWWKYKFCYGISVDQYHVEKDGTRTVIHLGKFDKAKHLEWLEKNPHKRPKPLLSHRKQITHLYSGGSPCDKTGRPRQTEVKLKCLENNSSPGAVALYLLEPKTCEYILGVESPLICNILSRADENGLVKMPELDDLNNYVTVSSEDEEDSTNDVNDDFDSTIANGDD